LSITSVREGRSDRTSGYNRPAVPYRQLAENEDMKRQAAALELAARLRRQKTRDARVFLAFWAVGSLVLIGSVWLADATTPTPYPEVFETSSSGSGSGSARATARAASMCHKAYTEPCP
jgi:hypothetical protein